MQVYIQEELFNRITNRLSDYGIILTLIQQEELNDIIDLYFESLLDTEEFTCCYCNKVKPLSQSIDEHLTDDISLLMCESCYLEGIDSTL